MPISPEMRFVPKNLLQWNRFLRESGSSPIDGSVETPSLADDAVTNAKLRNSGALSVIGRASNTAGDPADISSSSDDTFFVRRAGSLLWGALAAGDIPAAFITQHMDAISPFLSPPIPERRVDDAQALIAAQVFG